MSRLQPSIPNPLGLKLPPTCQWTLAAQCCLPCCTKSLFGTGLASCDLHGLRAACCPLVLLLLSSCPPIAPRDAANKDGQDDAMLPSEGTRQRDGGAVIGRDKMSATLVTGQDNVKLPSDRTRRDAAISPPPQPRSLCGFVVIVFVTFVSSSALLSPPSSPPLFCDLFDCYVVVPSPLYCCAFLLLLHPFHHHLPSCPPFVC